MKKKLNLVVTAFALACLVFSPAFAIGEHAADALRNPNPDIQFTIIDKLSALFLTIMVEEPSYYLGETAVVKGDFTAWNLYCEQAYIVTEYYKQGQYQNSQSKYVGSVSLGNPVFSVVTQYTPDSIGNWQVAGYLWCEKDSVMLSPYEPEDNSKQVISSSYTSSWQVVSKDTSWDVCPSDMVGYIGEKSCRETATSDTDVYQQYRGTNPDGSCQDLIWKKVEDCKPASQGGYCAAGKCGTGQIPTTYKECRNNACVYVQGAGNDMCANDDVCSATPPVTCTEGEKLCCGECILSSEKCPSPCPQPTACEGFKTLSGAWIKCKLQPHLLTLIIIAAVVIMITGFIISAKPSRRKR